MLSNPADAQAIARTRFIGCIGAMLIFWRLGTTAGVSSVAAAIWLAR